jgi:hypothetical protein
VKTKAGKHFTLAPWHTTGHGYLLAPSPLEEGWVEGPQTPPANVKRQPRQPTLRLRFLLKII